MATKTTATTRKLRVAAQKLGIKITRTLRGKRYYKSDSVLRKEIASKKKRKATATRKRKASSTAHRKRLRGASDTKRDEMYSAKKAGKRTASKYSTIEYIHTDPKTGKKTKRKYKRKNATSANNKYITPKKGNVYYENRRDRADKNKWL